MSADNLRSTNINWITGASAYCPALLLLFPERTREKEKQLGITWTITLNANINM
jgi:hypothetical protein